ncbi:MAG: DUF2061 domain-containing protein [Candidatus Komeilibacteria bacterium]|jgi:uncharacterized membrane protein|nr:DUF2061 domain-containing protein [Candidatus Komeilibacteria bacterium]
MFHEHHSRSLLKATTWFLLAFTITFITLTIINQDWKKGLLEAALVQALKAFVYYMHERIWNKSNYGQKLKKPAIVMK